jgi:two-component system, NarL family, invasion response regulator UvrY
MTVASAIRVLLADDHAVVREGYKRLLERDPAILVTGEASTGEQAYSLFTEHQPDVVVMDISLPGLSGIEAMRRILMRTPEARVLIFSMHEDVVYASRALLAGACGYVTKSSAPEVLVEAVRAVARGKVYIDHAMAQKLAMKKLSGQEDVLKSLSAREFEVFRLLASGHSVTEISDILNLNGKTVANYQSSIKQKLGVENVAQMARIAMSHGLIGNAADGA